LDIFIGSQFFLWLRFGFGRRKKTAAGVSQRRPHTQAADSGDVVRRPESGDVLPAASFAITHGHVSVLRRRTSGEPVSLLNF